MTTIRHFLEADPDALWKDNSGTIWDIESLDDAYDTMNTTIHDKEAICEDGRIYPLNRLGYANTNNEPILTRLTDEQAAAARAMNASHISEVRAYLNP